MMPTGTGLQTKHNPMPKPDPCWCATYWLM